MIVSSLVYHQLIYAERKYKLGFEEHMVDSPNAEQYAGLINHWLQECITNHSLCSQYRKNSYPQPKRIISLLPQGPDTREMECQLTITEEDPWDGKYITLSHRWGQGGFLTLSTSNINAFRDRIPVDLLPRIFQDALQVARSLGVQYIWIDSLCIVQDSPEDWEKEAPNMHAIYSNSYFNIAAASDFSSSEGDKSLFPQRSAHLVQPCLVQQQFPVLPLSHREWVQDPTLVLISSNLGSQRVNQSILYSRAWTVQERLLAPRVGNFCSDQLVWECAEMQACETFPRNLEKSVHFVLFPKALIAPLYRSKDQKYRKTAWARLLELYTEKQLTYPNDRLPAVAGIAKLFADSLNETYLAGLWGKDLLRQMLWLRKTPGKRKVRRGPTWSWSSMEAPVILLPDVESDDTINLDIATIIATHIKNRGKNVFGQALQGTITLSARICPFQTMAMLNCGDRLQYLAGGKTYADGKARDVAFSLFLAHRGGVLSDIADILVTLDDAQSLASVTHVLPLLLTVDAERSMVRGLLLTQIEQTEHNNPVDRPSFVRCGYFAGSSTRKQPLEVFGAEWDFADQKLRFLRTYKRAEIDII